MIAEKNYAGFWIRIFAGILDIAFLIPPFVILAFCFGNNEFQSANIHNNSHQFSAFSASTSGQFLDFLSYVLTIAYVGYFLTSKKQATIGKRLLGIYVGNCDGSKLTITKSFFRAIASLLTSATLGMGFLPVIFTKEKTALHDLICKTRVFYGKK